MKNKEFAVYRLFGLDLTSRKMYRRLLAMSKSANEATQRSYASLLKEHEALRDNRDELAKQNATLQNKLHLSDGSLSAAIEDYNHLRASFEKVNSDYAKLEGEFKQLESAYAQAKRELAKYHSKRGKNGRFVKKDSPQ